MIHKWSKKVTEHSNPIELEPKIFESHDAKTIARSLRDSAERGNGRNSSPYQAAMSMLTFYINRAGHNLPEKQKKILEKAKDELRHLFHLNQA